MKILFFANKALRERKPDHYSFAANHLAQTEITPPILLKTLYFDPGRYSFRDSVRLNLKFAWNALTVKHDVLYYGIDPTNLFLLTILKNLRLYRKPIYAWRYIALHKSKNRLAFWLKKRYWKAFDCVFMITESHVKESIDNGLIDAGRCRYVKWGPDLDYIDRIKPVPTGDRLTFVSTGRAYRDFETLCKAFKGVDADLKIFTTKGWGGFNYNEIMGDVTDSNIKICYTEEMDLKEYGSVLDYLYAELKAADAAMVICQQVNFGVGFTAVLDAMACGTPVIITRNKYNPIDADKRHIGCSVLPADAADLHNRLLHYVQHPELLREQGKNARTLAEQEYNIKSVAKEVIGTMLSRK